MPRTASDLRGPVPTTYSVKKSGQGDSKVSPYEDTANLSEFLGELSFSGYRDLGFNQILMVEGPSKTKTIQQFLRLYSKDHEVLLLQLAGSTLINGSPEAVSQLEEIKRISPHILAVIDSEKSSAEDALPANRTKFLSICDQARITCHVLRRRALENYFTDRAVKQVMGEKYRSLDPFEKRESVNPCWAKADNSRIARAMTKSEIEQTDFGQFVLHNICRKS